MDLSPSPVSSSNWTLGGQFSIENCCVKNGCSYYLLDMTNNDKENKLDQTKGAFDGFNFQL